jgi:OCT family organic cation transporter-like MFS transporter 4/5
MSHFQIIFKNFKKRCKIPDYENDTFAVQNDFHADLIAKYIPSEGPNTTQYDKCSIHVFANQTNPINSSSTEFTKLKCSSWVFSEKVYRKTIVTDVSRKDLFCA